MSTPIAELQAWLVQQRASYQREAPARLLLDQVLDELDRIVRQPARENAVESTAARAERSVRFHPQYGPMADTTDLLSDACPMCPPGRRYTGRTCIEHDWRMLRTEVVRLRALLDWLDVNDRVDVARHRRQLAKQYGRASRTIGELRGTVARLRAGEVVPR